MFTPEDREILIEAVQPLCQPLHDCLQAADETAELHFIEHDLIGTNYARERTDLTRAHMRKNLELAELGPWRVAAGQHNGVVRLHMSAMQLRVLHQAPNGAIPPPGGNGSRQDYWRNTGLELHGVQASCLLAVWSVAAFEPRIRIVRPVGLWAHEASPRVDVDFVLPRDAETLPNLGFIPDDSSIELPFFDDEDEAGETGDGSGW